MCLRNLKNNKAPGPDELNPELYKCLTKRESCMEIIGKSLQQEIDKAEKPNEWKMSKTKMIPKNSKPTPKDLRPIALTNISYKVFMKIVGEKIEEHITLNGENKNTQSIQEIIEQEISPSRLKLFRLIFVIISS